MTAFHAAPFEQIVLASLSDADLELKKLFIHRFCTTNRVDERWLIERLIGEGHLPKDAMSRWELVADIDGLIAYARDGLPLVKASSALGSAHSPSNEHFRKPAAFDRGAPIEVPLEQLPPERMLNGEVISSASDGPGLLKRLRSVRYTNRTHRPAVDFRDDLNRAARCDSSLKAVQLSGLVDFGALSSAHKAEAVRKLALAATDGALEEVHLDALGLDLACAEAIAALVRAPRLKTLTLLGNRLNEAAVQRIARAMREHPGVRELALGDQSGTSISVHAVGELLDAMETVPSLVRLRLGTIHDEALRRRYLRLETAHVEGQRKLAQQAQSLGRGMFGFTSPKGAPRSPKDADAAAAKQRERQREVKRMLLVIEDLKMRQAASQPLEAEEAQKLAGGEMERTLRAELEELTVAITASGLAAPPPPPSIVKTAWMVEADRIAASEGTVMGNPQVQALGDDGPGEAAAAAAMPTIQPTLDPRTNYILTGSNEWRAATKAERRAVIEAFATNAHHRFVCMSDSMIDDDLARSWASVLAAPSCTIEQLSLESNPISSAGIEALASALPSNSSLRVLKLRNLMSRVSKEAEEALASSLEGHAKLISLPMDLKSYKARDDIAKYVQRNEMRRREERGWKPYSAADARVSMGHEAGWKPAVNTDIKPPKIDAIHRHGKHVLQAATLWDGFFSRAAERASSANKGSASEAVGDEVLFDPMELPEVDPDELAAAEKKERGALPLVTLSDLTKSIQQKANEIFGRAGAAGSGVGEGGGGSKKKLNLPANPLADAAASAALAHEDKVHRDVEAFEALQAKHREEEVREHEAHLSLSWMLEQAGELAPPPAPASDEASNDATSKLVA